MPFNTCQTLVSLEPGLLLIDWLSMLGKNRLYDLAYCYKRNNVFIVSSEPNLRGPGITACGRVVFPNLPSLRHFDTWMFQYVVLVFRSCLPRYQTEITSCYRSLSFFTEHQGEGLRLRSSSLACKRSRRIVRLVPG